MAPTCNGMIKIVKLISYILALCSWVWLTACLEAEQWNINASENTDVSVKQEMVTYVAKGRQPFLFRSFSDIPAIEKSSADKTHLVSLGRRPETGAIPIFYRWRE